MSAQAAKVTVVIDWGVVHIEVTQAATSEGEGVLDGHVERALNLAHKRASMALIPSRGEPS